MKVIEVRPAKRFRSHWSVIEGPGVEPVFADQEQAIAYAKQRFRGSAGEIHLYDAAGQVSEMMKVDGGDIVRPNA